MIAVQVRSGCQFEMITRMNAFATAPDNFGFRVLHGWYRVRISGLR
jgi:hypothetical protein